MDFEKSIKLFDNGTIDYYFSYAFDSNSKIRGVELGSGNGFRARNLLHLMNGLILYCVDPWELKMTRGASDNVNKEQMELMYEVLKSKTESFGYRCKIIKGFIDEVSYSVQDNRMDFVIFGDNCTSFNERDFLFWVPKVLDNGIICGFQNGERIKQIIGKDYYEFIYCNEDDEWIFGPINESIRDWAIRNSKREGDWNESGYFESIRPDARIY